MNTGLRSSAIRITRTLSLRTKIMAALILVSLLSIAVVSVASIGISRMIILDNTDQMAKSLVKQIAYNLDERVKSFEDTTYSIMQQQTMRPLLTAEDEDLVSRQQKEQILSDAINQTPSLYRYVEYAFLENVHGQCYQYSSYDSKGFSGNPETTAAIQARILEGMDKQVPIRWMEIDGALYFARLIVNQRDFEIQGVAVYALAESFLDFIDSQDILSKENLIVTNRDGVLFTGGYDSAYPEINPLLTERWPVNTVISQPIAYHGQKTLVTAMNTPRKNWKILCLIRAADLYQKDRLVILFDLFAAAAALALSVLLTVFIVRSITGNITRMERCMTRVEAGDFNTRMKPANYDEVGKLGLRFNYMVSQMQRLIDTVARERTFKQQAEFRALQAQVNPHFLYNTLGSIKWLANSRGEHRVEAMVDSLIALLKGSIRKSTSFQTVAEEIRYIESYIALQKMRYGDAFTVEYQIDPRIGDAIVPGFLLQPIVENAIYHGIDIAECNGMICIRGQLLEEDGPRVVLQVEDNGVGLTEERIYDIMHRPKQYKGFNSIGVNLVYERLRIHYGEACSFAIHSRLDEGTCVKIELPYTTVLPDEEVAPDAEPVDRG